MKYKLTYEKVTEENINRALKIQRRLFPLENGEDDLKESINKSKKYYKYLEYYLVHNGKFYIGITGIYSYKEYPLDAWLGWYGVLPAFRRMGYGTKMFEFTKDLALKKGYKSLRVYADDKYDFVATNFYEKMNMFKEYYTKEKYIGYLVGDLIIYSLSLTQNKIIPWNNKNLFLKDHVKKNSRYYLKFVEINKNNIIDAARLQFNIFYSMNNVGYLDYLQEIKTHNRYKNKILPINFLVYLNNYPVGIIGLYEIKEYPDDIWINWFGVDAKYRNNGIGTQMLLKILDIAKHYNKKNFRLFTYETWNYNALGIYKKTMQLEENYDNKQENSFLIKFGKPKIYSLSLIDKHVEPWNNKFINLSDELVLNEKSIKKLKDDNLFNLFSESSFMETLRVD